MTPLARAIGIRSLYLAAREAGDTLTATALSIAVSTSFVALGRVEAIAYLLYVEATLTAPVATASTAIPVETSTRDVGDGAS